MCRLKQSREVKTPCHRKLETSTDRQRCADQRGGRSHVRELLTIGKVGTFSLLASSFLALLAIGLGSPEGHCGHWRGEHVGRELGRGTHRREEVCHCYSQNHNLKVEQLFITS